MSWCAPPRVKRLEGTPASHGIPSTLMVMIGKASRCSAPAACAMTAEILLLKPLEAFYFWLKIIIMTPRRASTACTPALLWVARREVDPASEWTASLFILITGRTHLKIKKKMERAASLLRGFPNVTRTHLVGDPTLLHLKTVMLTLLTRLRWKTPKFGQWCNGERIGDFHHNSRGSLQNRNTSRTLFW